jgi:calcineurin-like phosphoesterase family protein
MNEELVNRWNQQVKPEDVVYHLGDFSFKGSENARKWEQRLQGSIVHFQGNHDKNNGIKTYLLTGILVFSNKVVLAQHHPPRDANEIPKECDFVISGHVHDKWKYKIIEDIPIINVGVDVWDFKPVDANTVVSYFWKIKNNAVKE